MTLLSRIVEARLVTILALFRFLRSREAGGQHLFLISFCKNCKDSVGDVIYVNKLFGRAVRLFCRERERGGSPVRTPSWRCTSVVPNGCTRQPHPEASSAAMADVRKRGPRLPRCARRSCLHCCLGGGVCNDMGASGGVCAVRRVKFRDYSTTTKAAWLPAISSRAKAFGCGV